VVAMEYTTETRKEQIIAKIHADDKVRVSELAQEFGTSEVTIRKDLEQLESEGHLVRVHGGAVGLNKLYVNMDLSERYKTNSMAKKEIGETVARFIDDNDTIFMNAGTTLTYVLRAIQGKQNVSIVTNSVQNATEAALYSSFNVILLGGQLDSKYQFTYGTDAERQLENYHAVKCIVSVDGISAKSGLSLYYSNEAPLVRKMIESADHTIIVADSSKVGKDVFARITDARCADALVTSAGCDLREIEKLKKLGVKIYTK
jgi:DeoR/GlpR family transcriptional regulator of sugar metabolism